MPDRANGTGSRKRSSREYSPEEIALWNLTLAADDIWSHSDSSHDHLRQTCQKVWVVFNRIKDALKKTTWLDVIAELHSKHKKTVRDIIPFSHLAHYGNYEYDTVAERVFSNAEGETPFYERPFTLHNDGDLNTNADCCHDLSFDTSILMSEYEACSKMDAAMLDVCIFQELEYSARYHEDPTLGRPCDPPLGNFSRVCGSFDPIRFNKLVHRILQIKESTQESCRMSEQEGLHNSFSLQPNEQIVWCKWLLLVYPEIRHCLCKNKDMTDKDYENEDIAIDFINLLERPVIKSDLTLYPRPHLRGWGRNILHKQQLLERLGSDKVRGLWTQEQQESHQWVISNSLGVSLQNYLLNIQENALVPCNEKMTKSEKEKQENVKQSLLESNNRTQVASSKEKAKDSPNAKDLSSGASKIVSAPILCDLTSDEFPTLSEAANMTFHRRSASRQKMQGSMEGMHTLEWIEMSSPVKCNLHSKSDANLIRSVTQASDWHDCPISDTSIGIHSKTDSDVQLMDNFRHREEDAKSLVHSSTGSQNNTLDSAKLSSSLMPIIDDQMNINAPTFSPRPQTSAEQSEQTAKVPDARSEAETKPVPSVPQQQGKPPEVRRSPRTGYQTGVSKRRLHASRQYPFVSSYPKCIQPTSSRRVNAQYLWRHPLPRSSASCKPPPGFESFYSSEIPSSQFAPVAIIPSASPSVPMRVPPTAVTCAATTYSQRFLHLTSPLRSPADPYSAPNAVLLTPYQQSIAPPLNERIATRAASSAGPPGLNASNVRMQNPPCTLNGNMPSSIELRGNKRPSVGKGPIPVPDTAAYLLNMQQVAYPFSFPNQFLPNCNYILPTNVQPAGPPPYYVPTSGVSPRSNSPAPLASEMQLMWNHFPHPPPPLAAHHNYPVPQPSPPGSLGASNGYSNPLFPSATFGAGNRPLHYCDNVLPQNVSRSIPPTMSGSSHIYPFDYPWYGIDDHKNSIPHRTEWPLYHHSCPNSIDTPIPSTNRIIQNFKVDQTGSMFNINTINTNNAHLNDSRKARNRKRNPTNLVQLMASNYVLKRERARERARDRKMHARGNQPPAWQHEVSSACSHETLSEDSQNEFRTTEESPEEWNQGPTNRTNTKLADAVEPDSPKRCKQPIKPPRLNLEMLSGRSSDDAETYDDRAHTEKYEHNGRNNGVKILKNKPYQSCLESPSSARWFDASYDPEDEPNISFLNTKLGDLHIPSIGSLQSPPETARTEELSLSTHLPEESPSSFCSQSRQSISGSTHDSDPDTPSETSLLQQLARWNVIKISNEAKEPQNDDQPDINFRWIPKDDLENQASAKCSSQEDSHEDLANPPKQGCASTKSPSPMSSIKRSSVLCESHSVASECTPGAREENATKAVKKNCGESSSCCQSLYVREPAELGTIRKYKSKKNFEKSSKIKHRLPDTPFDDKGALVKDSSSQESLECNNSFQIKAIHNYNHYNACDGCCIKKKNESANSLCEMLGSSLHAVPSSSTWKGKKKTMKRNSYAETICKNRNAILTAKGLHSSNEVHILNNHLTMRLRPTKIIRNTHLRLIHPIDELVDLTSSISKHQKSPFSFKNNVSSSLSGRQSSHGDGDIRNAKAEIGGDTENEDNSSSTSNTNETNSSSQVSPTNLVQEKKDVPKKLKNLSKIAKNLVQESDRKCCRHSKRPLLQVHNKLLNRRLVLRHRIFPKI